jgi:hypothetical protein
MELEVCVWHGVGCDSDVIYEPSDDQIGAAIRQLNGAERNDLYLRHESGAWTGISGGPSRVMVTFAAGPKGALRDERWGRVVTGSFV